MRRKITGVFSLIFVFALGLGAWGCKTDDSKTLVLWGAMSLHPNYKTALKIDKDNPAGLMAKYVIETFMERNPGYKVRVEDKGWGDTLNENVVMGASSGIKPDILGTEVYTQLYIDMDYLAPLNFPDETKADIIADTTVGSTKGGNLYAAPIFTNVFAFLYNEDILKEAGCPTKYNPAAGSLEVIPPATFAELLYCADKVNAYYNTTQQSDRNSYGAWIINNVPGVGGAFRGQLYMRLAGGDFMKPEAAGTLLTASDIKIDTDENELAYGMMKKLYTYAPYDSYAILSEMSVYQKLVTGQVAMTFEHPSCLLYPAALQRDIRTAPMPVFTEGDNFTPFAYTAAVRDPAVKKPSSNILCGNVSYGVVKGTPKTEIAMDFINIMMSPEAQELRFKLDLRLPVTKGGMERVEKSTDAAVVKYHTIMEPSFTAVKDTYREINPVHIPGGPPCFIKNSAQIWTQYQVLTTAVLKNQTADVRGALTAFDGAVKQRLA